MTQRATTGLGQKVILTHIKAQKPKNVLDGCGLLHKIPWQTLMLYDEITHLHIDYVKNAYGPDSLLIFDGSYDKASTKDECHERRLGKNPKIASDIDVQKDRQLDVQKKAFLNNPANKAKFISLLMEVFKNVEFEVMQAEGDADYLIAQVGYALY